MAQYSKKRGADFTNGKTLSTDEKRRQWNVNLAQRALENMFGQVDLGDDVIIHNRLKKRVTYTPEQLMEMRAGRDE